MTAVFVFILPFALWGIGYGFYCLGRSLFCQKKEDRP